MHIRMLDTRTPCSPETEWGSIHQPRESLRKRPHGAGDQIVKQFDTINRYVACVPHAVRGVIAKPLAE